MISLHLIQQLLGEFAGFGKQFVMAALLLGQGVWDGLDQQIAALRRSVMSFAPSGS